MRLALRRSGRLSFSLIALPLCAVLLQAQGRAGRNAAAPEAATTSTDPVVENFHFRSIGPASMGGRIDDIAVSESNPNVIYVGYAVGGLFRSTNNATTFVPVFTKYQHGVHRRHRDSPDEPGHRVRRHRRTQQSPDVVVR